MKSLHTVLIASSFIVGSVLAASAQTSTTDTKPSANTGSSAITAATHCKDAKGVARLKDAAGATTGAAGGGMVGGNVAGSPNTNAGPAGGLSTTAQLPNC